MADHDAQSRTRPVSCYLTYVGLDELAADEAKWSRPGQPLAGAEPGTRAAQVMHVLLDELRRNLCIESEFLTEEKIRRHQTRQPEWLRAPWTLSDETGCTPAPPTRGPPARGASAVGGDLYVSGLGLYGRWLRRPTGSRCTTIRSNVKDADASSRPC